MKTVFNFELVLLLQLCYILHNATCDDNDRSPEESRESHSEENNSEIDQEPKHNHYNHHMKSDHKKYSRTDDRVENVPQYPEDSYECSTCACNKCYNPPDCCKKVCESCPKSLMQMQQFPKTSQMQKQMAMPLQRQQQLQQQMSQSMQQPMQQTMQQPMQQPMQQQMQQSIPRMMPPVSSHLQLPFIQQMPMHSLPMPPLPIPQFPMSQMPMQMPFMPMSPNLFSSPFGGQNPYYYPFPPNFMNMPNNLVALGRQSRTPTVTRTEVSTTTATTTTQVTTTESTSTKATMTEPTTTQTTTTQPTATRPTTTQPTTTEAQNINIKPDSNTIEKELLQSIVKNAIGDYSHFIMKMHPEKIDENDRYSTGMRKTKPIGTRQIGIIPLPDMMAKKLMLQMRNVQNSRRRSKRKICFENCFGYLMK